MFQIFPQGTNIPFMKGSVPLAAVSVIAVLLSLYFLATKGLNYGVDFAGGIQMVLEFPEDSSVDAESLRAELAKTKATGLSVQRFGTDTSTNEYMIHFAGSFADESRIRENLENSFGENSIQEFRLSGLERAYVRFADGVDLASAEANLKGMDWGLFEIQDVQLYGREASREYEISFFSISERLVAQLEEVFAPGEAEIRVQKLDFVGAKVGGDLKTAALLSLIVATFLIFVYVFLRFDLTYAPGVVIAMVHDVIIVAGVFSYLGIEFDLTTVAALLTLAGYSINDTIVIYDRIRETAQNLKGKAMIDMMNVAINSTLNRTVITSGTTLVTTLILFVFGGPVIQGFALALSIGIIVGTYSSVFVGGSLVLWTENYRKRFHPTSKKKVAAA